MKKTAVLLIQLGTPDSPKTSDVRRYLSQFLNDPRVIDLPWFARKLLVNGIIVPFRAPKSAKIYKELWDLGKGQSPLLVHTQKVQEKLKVRLKSSNVVFAGQMPGQDHFDGYDSVQSGLPSSIDHPHATPGNFLQ